MRLTRREFLSLAVTATALTAVVGCAGGGGTDTQTILALTQALGYEPVFDPDRAIGSTPYLSKLKRNGQIVMEGNLYFTVNGQAFFDNGQTGDKSVNSRVFAGDLIAWQQL